MALERQRLWELQTISHKQLREIEPETDAESEEALRIIPRSLMEVQDQTFDEEPLTEGEAGDSDSDNDVVIRPGLDRATLDKMDAAEEAMRRAEEAIAQMHRAEVRRGNMLAKKIKQVRTLLNAMAVVEEEGGDGGSLFPLASLEYVELTDEQAKAEFRPDAADED